LFALFILFAEIVICRAWKVINRHSENVRSHVYWHYL